MIKLRKLLACLMIACMAFSLMPLAAFATEGEPCTHVWQAAGGKHVCSVCSEEAAHSFEEGVCTVCGAEEPADPNAEAANNAPAEPADEEGGAAEETYAAQIGENGYATLAEALAAMQDGDTVTLLKDVEESFTLETNGTIDLNNKTLIGEIIIKADVVFRTGEIAQKSGQETAAVVLINSGSLKLEDTYINAGEYGGILVDSAETVSVELVGTVTSSQYGIMQSESSTGTLNVTSDPASGISGTKYGIYIRNGSYTARTTDEDTNDLNVRSNGTAIKIDKGSLSISGDKGSFEGALEIAEGVTCSITGGSFTVKPNVDSGYLAVYDESTKFYNVVPGVVVNDVTVKADVTGDSAPVTAADGITAPSGAASFACDSSAIDVQKLLAASKLTFLEGDVVSIELIPAVKIEAIEQTKNSVDSIEYSISPKAKITVTREGTEQKELEKELSVSNDMLKGGVDVTIPTVDGFTVLTQIVHIHSDGSTEEITKHSFGNNEVSFNVSSFSSFILYRSSMAIEVLDSNGKFSARYSSFSDALSAISGSSGWTIKLLQDVSIEAGNEYSYALAWKLDLAGNKLNTNNFYVYGTNAGQHSITIMDSSAAQSGQIVGSGTAAIDIGGKCTVTLESGSIVNTSGTAVAVKDNKNQKSAHFVMTGGTLNGTTALTADSGAVEISNGTVTGTNSTVDREAAILVNDNVTLTIKGGSVTNAKGNAISINGVSSQFTMSGGTVNGRTKGVDMYGGSAEISSGTIEGGTAINTVGSSITISGGTFDSTTADKEVVAATTGSTTVAISGGSFKHEVPKVQCADGYVPCADAKNPGRFSVEPISEPVARAEDALGVDKGTFSTVQDAINAAGLGGKVTLLRDNGDYATVSRSIVIDGAGCRMKNLTVMSIAGVKIMNLRADTVTVSANAKAELSGENVFTELVNNGARCEIIDGRYLSHTGSGTYAISGGVFGNEVTQDECALVPVTGKLTGTAASLTKYTPALNTDPETKDAYPYTVEVAPAPRITGISNNAYFQKGSSSTLTIYTDGDYDELVKAGTIYRCLHVYNANGTDLISSRYYTVEEDANGYAVITIANSFLRNRPTGTYSVQVDFTTGVTQLEDFRVGTSATPKTGDESNIGLWIGIMACSAIIIGCGVFVLVHKNKKNKK
ncbi:MAG: hypothetical protein DBY22_09275 [Clostridiales bacterium]|nr:MAG: hypothetical protein DBY22_09275 [Clostridiales bacterium]